jgi:hypothetical protein
MTTSIKITALNSIGANIAFSTLVPVVNMAGTPVTEKATLALVGNLILTGAGGSNFPPANTALLAQSVSNAAQPNITSVGTLTSLAVTGNVSAGNLNGGNLVSANFFSGDGGLLSNIAVGSGTQIENGTSNVVVTEDGNVNVSVAGTSDVLVISNDVMTLQGEFISAYFKTTPVTFSVLPDPAAGLRAFITDASASAFGEIVAGGGANNVPVFGDGTNWRVG